MEQKEIIHQILQVVKDIENYTDTFVAQEQVPLVEVDIALDKTKKLYDLLHDLKRDLTYIPESLIIHNENEAIEEIDFNAIEEEYTKQEVLIEQENPIQVGNVNSIVEQPQIVLEQIQPIEVQKEIIPQILNIEEPILEFPEVEDLEIKLIVKEVPPVVEEKPLPIVEKEPEVVTPKEPTMASKQINLHLNSDKDLGTKLSKKPILNISSAIPLNDRFQFIKELFHNNSNEYNTTIQYLNSANDLHTAMEFINLQFDWDSENPLVQSFLSIVERRFL